MVHVCSLDQLNVGDSGQVVRLDAHGSVRKRMLDLGIVDGTRIEAVQKSPSGDPVAYFIRGALIALWKENEKNILVCC